MPPLVSKVKRPGQTEASFRGLSRIEKPSIFSRVRDRLNEWELPLIGGVGDALSSILPTDSPSEAVGSLVSPLTMGPAALMSSLPSSGPGWNPLRRPTSPPFPQTSTRVENARRVVEDAGIDTQMARNLVPRRGTDAERFAQAIRSINPVQAQAQIQSPTGIASIEDLIGPGYQNLGRMGLGGISPKRVLRSASGDKYLHKGTAWQQGGGMNLEDRPEIIALADPDEVAKEDSVSWLANILSEGNRTPRAQEVREGGSLQKILYNNPNLPTLHQAGVQPMLDPNLVKQLQDEHVIDSLLRVSDRHPGQFVLSPDQKTVHSIDKGLGGFEGYLASPFFTPSGGDVYSQLERGKALNRFANPQNYSEAINRVRQVPEQTLRSAMDPFFRGFNVPSQTQDHFFRNFMQARDLLPRAFNDYYRGFVQP